MAELKHHGFLVKIFKGGTFIIINVPNTQRNVLFMFIFKQGTSKAWLVKPGVSYISTVTLGYLLMGREISRTYFTSHPCFSLTSDYLLFYEKNTELLCLMDLEVQTTGQEMLSTYWLEKSQESLQSVCLGVMLLLELPTLATGQSHHMGETPFLLAYPLYEVLPRGCGNLRRKRIPHFISTSIFIINHDKAAS